MGFKLRVHFEGVFAFVPSEPFFSFVEGSWKAGKPSQVWVLVPRLAAPDLADWDREVNHTLGDYRLQYRMHHHPLFSVRRKHVRYADRKLHPFQMELGHGLGQRRHLVRSLRQDLLSFTDGGNAFDLPLECALTVPEPANQQLPSAKEEERRSLWWVPQLDVITCGRSKITCENNPSDGSFGFGESDLDAALLLDSGRLSVSGFNSRETPWEFAGATRDTATGELLAEPEEDRTWKRAIGNQLVWEVDVSSSFAGVCYSSKSELEFRVRPPLLGKRVVELWISNEEPERYLVHDRHGADPIPELHDDRDDFLPFDPDFQVLYQLTEETHESGPKRYPYYRDAPFGRDGRPCSGGTGGF